jgi:hypothetical protein
MKRIVPVIVLGCIVGFGFYRGWFALSSHGAGTKSSKVDVNLTVDKGQMQKDAQTVKTKATEMADTFTGPAKEASDQATKGR